MISVERQRQLRHAADVAIDDPRRLTVRELMTWFGAAGRGYKVIDRMRRELAAFGLRTEPDFAGAHIDSTIQLVRREPEDAAGDEAEGGPEVQLRVSSLKAATNGVVSVAPDDSIDEAASLMLFHDFSQLAVSASERSFKGYISWETIGTARLKGEPKSVREGMRTDARIVQLDDALLPVLTTVADADFVFVQAVDKTLSGIITSADITLEFEQLAAPYLVLGEIERRLRRALDATCTAEELAQARAGDDDERAVDSAEDLTIGEMARLLERRDVWERLGWALDRRIFIKRLREVRRIRNDLMHFAEDAPSREDIKALKSFARALGELQ